MRNTARYRIFWFTLWLLQRLPRRTAYRAAALLGELSYALNASGRRVAISNMRHVLGPSASPRAVTSAARGCFRAACYYYADLARTPLMEPDAFIRRRVRATGYGWLAEAVASGRGVVVATLHYGNPEYTSQCLVTQGLTFLALVEPLEPPELHRLFQDHRRSQGHQFVAVGVSGIKQAVRRLRAGGIVAVLIDRDIQHSGVEAPFFGAMARLPVGAVDLALHTGAHLLPMVARRVRLDEFAVTIEPPMTLLRTGNRERDRRDNTARLIGRFEKYLRQDPSQWFVLEEPVWPAAPSGAAGRMHTDREGEDVAATEESAG